MENVLYLPSRRVHVHLPRPVESFPVDVICAFAVAFIVRAVPPGYRHGVSELRCVLWLNLDSDFGLIFSILWWKLSEKSKFDSDLFRECSAYKATLALLILKALAIWMDLGWVV